MKTDSLSSKIGLGYALMVTFLACAVLVTIWQVREIQATADRLITLREPTSRASGEVLNGINNAAAALRGWLLAPDPSFETEWRVAWEQEIHLPLSRLEQLSANWRDPESRVRLDKLNTLIDRLEPWHQQAWNLASTDKDTANGLLREQIVPLVFKIRDLLKEMVGNQSDLLENDFKKIAGQITLTNTLEWGLLIAGLGSGLLLALLIARAVTRPITSTVRVAHDIAEGNLDTAVDIGGAREVTLLGNALTNMRDSLKAKTLETERYAWLSNGQNQLNQVMRGDKGIEELATDIIGFIATYTGSSTGSLYLLHDNPGELRLTGSYAFGRDELQSTFHMGKGLIGQAAADRKPLLIDNLDEDNIRVQSSLLDMPPRNLYIAPVLFGGHTLGVLELGKLDVFGEQSLEFVQSGLEAIGIALNSAIARKKIQDLLEETQRQSEELQQQQEELEQTNEELEEQTRQLKEQQEELQATNEELEEQTQVVAQKNKDLEAARTNIELKARQLEVSSKYKSEFLANMSHELRTPLNSLLILANDLADNADGNLTVEQVESAQVISRSGHDLLSLINDILDLSKIEAGKMDLSVSAVSPTEIADNIRRTFARQAAAKGLGLHTHVDELLPEVVSTDKQRLEQILRNLLANALKFTEAGEININFRREAGDFLAITVRDTGIGIPKDKHDLIFQAFLQLEGGTARKYGGTGLGLSICRDLATLLGGKLSVDSEPGGGSAFTLVIPLVLKRDLPVVPEEPARHNRKQVTSEPDRNRYLDYPSIPDQRDQISSDDRTILIIEDDDDFARILASQARDKGFKHLNAATGEDGLALAARFQPQAIILDLDLPGIDGHLVLKELKSNPDLRHIPVHIMSVNEKSLDPIKSGAVDYLTKPVDKAQLDAAFSRMEDFINRKMKNLLVIEDDDNLRKSIVRLIGNGDVLCHEAGTARDALEILENRVIDCLVLDVGLPDMSGFELIRQLERSADAGLPGGRVPPIIVYTGRELSRQENDQLQQYTQTIIVKGVKSEERLLDETALFLHRTLGNLPPRKQEIIANLYDSESQLQGKQILLVDDDMRNVFALGKVLADKGMHIIKADNGKVALQALTENPQVDFVLMDIMMPEMDGYECMREIRKQRHFRELPIVALTAKAMKDDRQKCIDAGANDYIAKPVEIDRLLSLMRIWMRK